jgi:predicted small lipoprotein YifL
MPCARAYISFAFASNEIYIYLFLLHKSIMKKVLVLTVIAMLVLLAACGGKQMEAKPLSSRSPTAAAVSEPETAAPSAEESSGETAAQAIVDLREQMQNVPATTTTSSPKEGSTGMPPAPAGVTGKDALAARTKALFSKSTGITEAVDVVTTFPDYSKESNLPEGYGGESQ